MKARRIPIAERAASRTNRLVHAYARAGALSLKRFGKPGYANAQRRCFRLYTLLPASIQSALVEQP